MPRLRKQPAMQIGRKYLWTIFIAVLIIAFSLSLALMAVYSGVQIHRTSKYSAAQLNQAGVSTDILYENLEAVVNEMVVDRDTATFLLSTKMDRRQEASVGIKVRAVRAANPTMRYVTLYNTATGRFVSSATAGNGEQLDVDELYRRLANNAYACFYRPIGSENNLSQRQTTFVYTFLFPVQMQPDQATDLVIIDVNNSYFDRALAPIRVPDQDQNLVIRDSNGEILVRMTAPRNRDAFTVLSGTEDSQELILPEEGHFVSRATATRAGWTLTNILPFGSLLSGLGTLLLLTSALLVVTLGFGYLLSRQAGASLAVPIKILYEHYVSPERRANRANELELLNQAISDTYARADRLEQGLISSYEESKKMYLRYLLDGDTKKVRSSQAAYEQLKIDLASPYYGIAMMECVPSQSREGEVSARDPAQFINYYALENVVTESVSAVCPMEYLRLDEIHVALLLYLSTPEIPPAIVERLTSALELMRREFQLEATVCIGNVVDQWRDLNLDYEQTLMALGAHSAQHYGKVFFSREVPASMSSELYYNDLPLRFSEAIRSGSVQGCAEAFDQVIMALQDIRFTSARGYFRHVLMSVLDEFSSTLGRDHESFTQLLEQLEQVDHCHNVQSLKSVTLDFLTALADQLARKREHSNQDVALQAREYIDLHYSDPDLTLHSLAEQVGLSPAYLGRVFTSVTTFSFNDYLNKTRMEQAARLLTTTSLPITQISEQVGVLNTNYFYSLFKKQYGQTPASYRKENRAAAE